jgi:hypothetical protein
MNNKLNINIMRKFKNTGEIVLFTYQATLTGLFVFGFVRVVIGLITGEFANVSFGIYN